MFLHNYLYRLKCNIRDKETLFWTLLFPILIATFFYMAFSNLSAAENFKEIKIGIVDNNEFQGETNFKNAIESTSDLFVIEYTTKENADSLLNDNKITGYIHFDNGLKLIVKESGINQTILKGFLDDYKQTSSTVYTIINKNPDAINNGLLEGISNREDYLKAVNLGNSAPDNTVSYFYALIAMACLYGAFWGEKEVASLQANLSPKGARVSVAPVHKLKVFLTSMLAATTVQLGIILTFLAYLTMVLRVDFGNQIGYILLTCVVGTLTGVTFGCFLSSAVKTSDGFKVAILIVTTNVLSFLAGMMYAPMKYIISQNAPLVGYLNPINLVSDSFYCLYYYSSYTNLFINIAILCGFIFAFSAVTFLVIRREKYASL